MTWLKHGRSCNLLPDEVDDTTQGSHHFSKNKKQSAKSTTRSVDRHAVAESTIWHSSHKTNPKGSINGQLHLFQTIGQQHHFRMSPNQVQCHLKFRMSSNQVQIPSKIVSIHRVQPKGASVAIPDEYA